MVIVALLAVSMNTMRMRWIGYEQKFVPRQKQRWTGLDSCLAKSYTNLAGKSNHNQTSLNKDRAWVVWCKLVSAIRPPEIVTCDGRWTVKNGSAGPWHFLLS